MVADMPIPTMVRSIAEAKAHFSAIVDEASGGKAFVICRAGRPLVTITQYVHLDSPHLKKEHRRLIADASPSPIHNDPFDRIMVCQSMVEKIPLISYDRNVNAYFA